MQKRHQPHPAAVEPTPGPGQREIYLPQALLGHQQRQEREVQP